MLEVFNCIPIKERYYSEDSSFGVYLCETNDDVQHKSENNNYFSETQGQYLIVLAGKMQQLNIGSSYKVEAVAEHNNKYNSWQYNPEKVLPNTPKTLSEQETFLKTILTENQSKEILREYPNFVDDVINGKTDFDCSKMHGIGQFTLVNIIEKVFENYVISDILILLAPFGVSYNTICRLLNIEKNPILLKQMVVDNPYTILDATGFGFKTTDAIAQKINPGIKHSEKRVDAYIKYHLKELSESIGDTYCSVSSLKKGALEHIPECMDIFEDVVEKEKELECYLHFNEEKVGLKRLHYLETSIIDTLKEIDTYPSFIQPNAEHGIETAEKELGFNLTEEQKNIVRDIENHNVLFISGVAGSGKSSSMRAIVNALKPKYSISCAALSAKASQRIVEATGESASTIHRLLGLKPGVDIESQSLYSDVIIIDECSMINVQIFHALVKSVKFGSKLILCGDHKQLPPIGAGNVFSDLLKMKNLFCVHVLTKVMRQAEESGILADANKIRKGISPINDFVPKQITGTLQDMTYMFRDDRDVMNNLAIKTYLKAVENSSVDDTIILVPRKAKCINSTFTLNSAIQQALFSDDIPFKSCGNKVFKLGSKVIQKKNDYDRNVFNGEIGYVTKIRDDANIADVFWDDRFGNDDKSVVMVVEFPSYDNSTNETTKNIGYTLSDMLYLELAYALTVHSAQGSGYKNVIVIIDNTHYTLLDSCLLYTAITRSKKKCLLVAEPYAFQKCIDNNKSKSRKTWMLDTLRSN